jgi:hypothetical protein
MADTTGERGGPAPDVRVRAFIDFWNFQLSLQSWQKDVIERLLRQDYRNGGVFRLRQHMSDEAARSQGVRLGRWP